MVYSEIRRQARENLRGNWLQAILVAVIAGLLGGNISSAGGSAGGSAGSSSYSHSVQSIPPEILHFVTALLTVLSILAVLTFLIGGAVQLGYSVYLLKQYHRQKTYVSDLFSQFFRFGTGFAQKFLVGLFTFLWSLLLVIPGIIKAYSYAMTPFILADYPDLSATEAITRSRQLMDGHKWELFVLMLSFIGWEFLSALTLGIGFLWVVPYKNAAMAVFYRQISGPQIHTAE